MNIWQVAVRTMEYAGAYTLINTNSPWSVTTQRPSLSSSCRTSSSHIIESASSSSSSSSSSVAVSVAAAWTLQRNNSIGADKTPTHWLTLCVQLCMC